MNIYKATQLPPHRNTKNSWTQVRTIQPTEINGNIYSVIEVSLSVVEITSTAKPLRLQEIPTCFLYVLIEWVSTWL